MKKILSFLLVPVMGAAIALAQTPATATDPKNPNATQVARTDENQPVERNQGFNPGWLGLIGLFGLAGLRRREGAVVRTHEVDRTTETDRARNERFGRDRDDVRRVG